MDNWQEWGGGENPFKDEPLARIDYKLKRGYVGFRSLAYGANWSRPDMPEVQIVSYRRVSDFIELPDLRVGDEVWIRGRVSDIQDSGVMGLAISIEIDRSLESHGDWDGYVTHAMSLEGAIKAKTPTTASSPPPQS